MNLRKVAIRLIACLSFVITLSSIAAEFQQGQIRGPKNSGSQNSRVQNSRVQNSQAQISDLTYGPIVSSDTLWRIASLHRQNRSLSVYQVMYGIYQLNPDAFENDNINLLKDGSILKLPSERYTAGLDKQEAIIKTQDDEARWQPNPSGESKASRKPVSVGDLNETKAVIEEKLGAIDEEQNRQFMAIRQQFAESINSVQAILSENQKLFERLDSVNTDINGLRAEEQQRDQQISVMGKSIDELLNRARKEEEARRMAEAEGSAFDWLTEPLSLIILSILASLSMLSGFAYWLMGRKKASETVGEADELELPDIHHSTEMDDLSDSLSDELSEELGEELDDDNLFGDDDLLDDVLAEELEESLDPEIENFDDLGEDMLVPDDSTDDVDFEGGAEVIEQDDLDNLFEEDDDLLAEIDEDLKSVDLSDTESSGDDVLPDESMEDELEETLEIDDIEPQEAIDEEVEPLGEEAQAEILANTEDDNEQPEISIDELLDESNDKLPESAEVDIPDEISEELLQQLDKEIASQSEELDNITGNLIEELEQVEQMQAMLPDDDSDEPDTKPSTNPQHGIQTFDEISDELDESLSDDSLEEIDEILPDVSMLADVPEDIIEVSEDEESEVTETGEHKPESSVASQAEVEAHESEVAVDDEIVEPPAVQAETQADPEEPVQAQDLGKEQGASQEPETSAASQPEIEASEPEIAADDEIVEPLAAKAETQLESKLDTEEPAQTLSQGEEQDAPQELEVSAASQPEAEVHESDTGVDDEIVEPLADQTESQLESDTHGPVDAEDVVEEQDLPQGLDIKDAELADEVFEQEAESVSEITELDEQESADSAIEKLDLEQGESESPEAEAEAEAEAGAGDIDAQSDEHLAEVMDDDQLERALEDFEHQELEEVLEDLTSDTDANLLTPSLEDLEFGSQQELVELSEGQERETPIGPLPDLEDIASLADFDDAELENALDELDEQDGSPESLAVEKLELNEQSENTELDDMPGLGDWLNEPNAEDRDEDTAVLDELENATFDELLETIDIDEQDDEATEIESDADSDFDIDALLSEAPEEEALGLRGNLEEDEFLDVDTLLTESIDAESQPLSDKELHLDVSLDSFTGVGEDSDTIDVDSDNGMGAKLDLAHAYIEMGEIESARELLDEIKENGEKEQQEEAKQVLSNLE